MISSTVERLTFFWIQADEHHSAEHLFNVDERGCIDDVATAAPGYIELRKRVVDQGGEVFIEAKSSVDLFMLHRSLVAEFPIRADERYSIDEIIEMAEDLLARRAGASVPNSEEVCHDHAF